MKKLHWVPNYDSANIPTNIKRIQRVTDMSEKIHLNSQIYDYPRIKGFGSLDTVKLSLSLEIGNCPCKR